MIIRNSKFEILNSKRGFTLVEILVAISVMAIIMVMGSNMFFTILKGATKTRVLTEVKQNGNYAVSVMQRMIRNAKRVENQGSNHITIRNPDGEETTFRFYFNPYFLIASESAGLTGSNARLTSENVKLISGTFSHTEGGESQPDKVVINFILSRTEGARVEETASVDFKTTVILRNID